jgi:hypothetical protein
MSLRLLLCLVLSTPALLCGCEAGELNFAGRVYDGASGDRIAGYTIFAEYWQTVTEGAVDESGRYTVGGIPQTPGQGNDFSILIAAEGYRSFMSHNSMPVVEGEEGRTENLYYDAYLFPAGLLSPPVTFDINLALTDAEAEGLIRLEPSSSSFLYDDSSEPAGVDDGDYGSQVWSNDEDLQFRSVTKAFSGGEVTFAEGELVYGVSYDVTVFDVDGYGPIEASYTAGVQGHQSWTLQPSGFTELALVFASTDLGLWSADGSAVLTFNQPIEFFGSERLEEYEEALDDGSSIVSPDSDDDGERNILFNDTTPDDDSDVVQERGTAMVIEENRLLLSWSSAGLEESDADDPIEAIHYGGFADIDLVSARGPITNRSSLSDLLGSGTLTVEMVP